MVCSKRVSAHPAQDARGWNATLLWRIQAAHQFLRQEEQADSGRERRDLRRSHRPFALFDRPIRLIPTLGIACEERIGMLINQIAAGEDKFTCDSSGQPYRRNSWQQCSTPRQEEA